MRKAALAILMILMMLIGVLVGVLSSQGCATTGNVLTTCEATATQADFILKALGSSPIESVAVAAVDALKYGCATGWEVDQFITAHQTDASAAFMAEGDPLDSRRLANALAYKRTHP